MGGNICLDHIIEHQHSNCIVKNALICLHGEYLCKYQMYKTYRRGVGIELSLSRVAILICITCVQLLIFFFFFPHNNRHLLKPSLRSPLK